MTLYSLTEIAQELNIAPSTLRYQAKLYEDLLPKREVEGERWPKYEQEAVDILRLIMDKSGEGLSREEIKDLIFKQWETVYHNHNQITTRETAPPLPSLSLPLRELHELNATLSEMVKQQRELMQIKDEELVSLRAYVAQLEQKLYQEQRAHRLVRETSSFWRSLDSLLGRSKPRS